MQEYLFGIGAFVNYNGKVHLLCQLATGECRGRIVSLCGKKYSGDLYSDEWGECAHLNEARLALKQHHYACKDCLRHIEQGYIEDQFTVIFDVLAQKPKYSYLAISYHIQENHYTCKTCGKQWVLDGSVMTGDRLILLNHAREHEEANVDKLKRLERQAKK